MSETNGHLDKAAILGKTALPIMELDIPEWEGKVFIRVMTAKERDLFEARQRRDDFENIRARIARASLCDDNGNLLFTDEDIATLSNLHGKALDRIFEAAVKFNKIGSKDIDELKKTSEPIHSGASSSS